MKIRGIEIYHPSNVVTNDYYLKRFGDQTEQLEKMLNFMGKDKRFISEDEDNLEMAKKATGKVLSSTNIDISEIGGVFFASQTPEYMMPTNAVLLHKEFGLDKNCFCIDVNTNCAGMVSAFELAYGYFLMHRECKYILLVGSERLSRHSSKDCIMTYPIFGDMACAVILERSENSFLESMAYSNTKYADQVLFPSCGMSDIYKEDKEKHIDWSLTSGTAETTFGPAVTRVKAILERNNISRNEIGLVCCNQNSKSIRDFIVKELEIEDTKCEFIGDKYGYTGSTTSFLCVNDALKGNKIKDGEYIVFCSAGAGSFLNVVVFQYKE